MVFKGAVHISQWVKFLLVLGLTVAAFLSTDFNTRSSFVIVPGIMLMNLISKYLAKLTIDKRIVKISQFDNRHEFDLSTIRKIEKIEYSGWKKLLYPTSGIHIFYNRFEDVIFYPKEVDALDAALREAAKKELKVGARSLKFNHSLLR